MDLSSLDRGWSGPFTILSTWADATPPLGTHRSADTLEAYFRP